MQGGLHAAACIRRDLAGKPRRHNRYHDLGSADLHQPLAYIALLA
jgi:NADH dehydrogenase